jgi:hypothetical protein
MARTPLVAVQTSAGPVAHVLMGVSVEYSGLRWVAVTVTARSDVEASCTVTVDGVVVDTERASGVGGEALCAWAP